MHVDRHGQAMADIIHRVAGDHADVWTISSATRTEKEEVLESHLSASIDYAVREKARVIVMSMSGDGRPETAYAVARALDAGVVVVQAVGNDGVQDYGMMPSNDRRVLRVGSVLRDGARAPESNFGVTPEGITVANVYAPGRLEVAYPDGKKDVVMGTSFAAPVVAAEAGLLLDAGAGSISGPGAAQVIRQTAHARISGGFLLLIWAPPFSRCNRQIAATACRAGGRTS